MDESLMLGEIGSLALFVLLASFPAKCRSSSWASGLLGAPVLWLEVREAAGASPWPAGESSCVTAWFLSPDCSVGDLFPSASQALLPLSPSLFRAQVLAGAWLLAEEFGGGRPGSRGGNQQAVPRGLHVSGREGPC